MPAARPYAAAGVVNGLLYTVGGSSKDTLNTRTVYAYDPGSNNWATRASLPSGRWAPSAGVINGVLYVAGGTDVNFKPTTTLFAYTPATNTWMAKAPMLDPGACGAADVIGGKLYVLSQCETTAARIWSTQPVGRAAQPAARRRIPRRVDGGWISWRGTCGDPGSVLPETIIMGLPVTTPVSLRLDSRTTPSPTAVAQHLAPPMPEAA